MVGGAGPEEEVQHVPFPGEGVAVVDHVDDVVVLGALEGGRRGEDGVAGVVELHVHVPADVGGDGGLGYGVPGGEGLGADPARGVFQGVVLVVQFGPVAGVVGGVDGAVGVFVEGGQRGVGVVVVWVEVVKPLFRVDGLPHCELAVDVAGDFGYGDC